MDLLLIQILFIWFCLTLFVFPIPCVIWLIVAVVRYVRSKKSNSEGLPKRKKMLKKAVIFTVIELLFFAFDLSVIIYLIMNPISFM